MIEELRKSIHNESNPANKHSSENADLNYRFGFFLNIFPNKYFKSISLSLSSRRLKILKDDYDKQIEQLKQHHDLSVKRLNSEIEKLNGEKFSLLTELDAAKLNGHFNNQNNNTTSVSNNHHFVNQEM